jgi:hypothetical protein
MLDGWTTETKISRTQGTYGAMPTGEAPCAPIPLCVQPLIECTCAHGGSGCHATYYIAPSGRRMSSYEEVALYFGLPRVMRPLLALTDSQGAQAVLVASAAPPPKASKGPLRLKRRGNAPISQAKVGLLMRMPGIGKAGRRGVEPRRASEASAAATAANQWSQLEDEQLARARLAVSPLCRTFWEQVARHVGSRSAHECARRAADRDAATSPTGPVKRRREQTEQGSATSPTRVAATPLLQLGKSSPVMRYASPWRIEEVSEDDGDDDSDDNVCGGLLRELDADHRSQMYSYVHASKAKRLKDNGIDVAWRQRRQPFAGERMRVHHESSFAGMASQVREATCLHNNSMLEYGTEDLESDLLDELDDDFELPHV